MKCQEEERKTTPFSEYLPFYRPPPERKSKDSNSVKRVRAKRTTDKNIDEQNQPVEEKEDAIDDQQVSYLCCVHL